MIIRTKYNQGDVVYTVDYTPNNEYVIRQRRIKAIIVRDDMILYEFDNSITIFEELCFNLESDARKACNDLNSLIRKGGDCNEET